ncbi:hypothetical protein PoB_005180900 [Plakobranchus ocellatus]|uniref:Uncharacterized protein n=1 Tax=Plakobranchus ocellatus TaxID=259542 RepID=A0AAV4C3P3_9GAST|nr:hypothetical protein PoB_005180900 [Plakobranchus ocellatus]
MASHGHVCVELHGMEASRQVGRSVWISSRTANTGTVTTLALCHTVTMMSWLWRLSKLTKQPDNQTPTVTRHTRQDWVRHLRLSWSPKAFKSCTLPNNTSSTSITVCSCICLVFFFSTFDLPDRMDHAAYSQTSEGVWHMGQGKHEYLNLIDGQGSNIEESPQQIHLKLLGPPPRQGAGGEAQIRDRMVPADFRAGSLSTAPPTPTV